MLDTKITVNTPFSKEVRFTTLPSGYGVNSEFKMEVDEKGLFMSRNTLLYMRQAINILLDLD